MRMIRPYGQSVVEEKIRQMLLDDKENKNKTPQDIYNFIINKPELILNFAISTLDKIILKPKQDKEKKKSKKCHNDIHEVRHEMGEALWTKLLNDKIKQVLQKKLSDENKITEETTRLKDLWDRKIKPYETSKVEADKHYPYGRYFTRFTGIITNKSTKLEQLKINHEQISDNIIEHLFEHEYCLGSSNAITDKKHSKGKIYNIAEAISKSIIKMPDERKYLYTNEDIETYFEKVNTDFAKEICCKYHCESTDNKLTFEIIMPILHANYQPVFGAVTIEQAKKDNNALLAVHMEVKEFYKALVYKNKKLIRLKYDYKSKVDMLLPKNNEELKLKLIQKHDNQDINSDIRLGKILHYTNAQKTSGGNITFDITSTDITKSSYWTSEGQKEIKRSEAFIKTWFNFIAFASHSLTYLVGKKLSNDITDGRMHEEALKIFDDLSEKEIFRKNLDYLLGSNSTSEKYADKFDNKEILEFFLKTFSPLRHNIFHFKGTPDFKEIFAKNKISDKFKETIHELWKDDQKQAEILFKESLKAVFVEYYLTKEQLEKYCGLVKSPWQHAGNNYAPKFKQIIQRAHDIHDKDNTLRILTPPDSNELKTELFQCQYTLLKTLYETDFQTWFSKTFMEKHYDWIEPVQERAKKATKDKDKKAKNLKFPNEYSSLQDYLDKLLSLEAREGSIQNGYDVNKEKQDDLSDYINNFKKDVMIFAFRDYLSLEEHKELKEITQLRKLPKEIKDLAEEKKRENKKCDIEDVWGQSPPIIPPNEWQAQLYLLFHLAPVGMICQLQHQIDKYSVLIKKCEDISNKDKKDLKENEEILQVCKLYRVMHDAKFEGSGYDISEKVKSIFYEKILDYDKVFNKNNSLKDKETAQHRHVREMVRFGVGEYLEKLAQDKIYKISSDDVQKWKEHQTPEKQEEIKKLHEKKAELHNKWEKSKRRNQPPFISQDTLDYDKKLKEIIKYRELNNRVKLFEYRKLHDLTMKILGRLVGFSFMYERDLYFLTLTYVYKDYLKNNSNLNLEKYLLDFFNNCNERVKNLKNGQVISSFDKHFVLKKNKLENKRCVCSKECKPHEPSIIKDMLVIKKNRNNFAHFNMLRDKNNSFNITDYINQARTLMDYDRKLKNAVAKSMIGLCQKENIEVKFEMDNTDKTHKLKLVGHEGVKSKKAKHLGDTKIDNKPIEETLHSCAYIKMVKALF